MNPENKIVPIGPKKEGPIQLRTLIAFGLMGLVIFATPYFYKFIAPPAPPKPIEQTAGKTIPSPTPSANTAEPIAANPAEAQAVTTPAEASATSAVAEQTTEVDTQLYRIVFSNRGAVVRSWLLKDYKDRAGKPLELVNSVAAPKVGYPFSLEYRGNKPAVDLNRDALFVLTKSADGHSLTFDYSGKGTIAKKVFEFQNDGYLTRISSEVSQNGSGLPHMLAWRGGFGDLAVQNPSGQISTIHYDLPNTKLTREGAKFAKNGPVNVDGTFSFAGLEDQYFTAAFVPTGNGSVATTAYDDQVATPFDKSEQAIAGAAVGGEARNSLTLFVGPKDIPALRKVNPKLEQIVDFGYLAILAKPLFLVLQWLNNQFVHNYGWSIVLVTLCINILLFPLKLTNMKSMKKMQVLQPQIAAINEKYKSIPFKDPRQQQKNEETMALYKKHGANPMGGCIPLLIQMPFLFAFYKVLAVSIEMRNASWLWVGDLSQPEHLAIRILPILMIVSGFIMQRMTPATGGDPNQQKMMAFMPLMMGFFFWSAQSGLVLYWLTGNLVGIGQQLFFNKTMTPAEILPVPKTITVKKTGRK